jgi:hypothetical protein
LYSPFYLLYASVQKMQINQLAAKNKKRKLTPGTKSKRIRLNTSTLTNLLSSLRDVAGTEGFKISFKTANVTCSFPETVISDEFDEKNFVIDMNKIKKDTRQISLVIGWLPTDIISLILQYSTSDYHFKESIDINSAGNIKYKFFKNGKLMINLGEKTYADDSDNQEYEFLMKESSWFCKYYKWNYQNYKVKKVVLRTANDVALYNWELFTSPSAKFDYQCFKIDTDGEPIYLMHQDHPLVSHVKPEIVPNKLQPRYFMGENRHLLEENKYNRSPPNISSEEKDFNWGDFIGMESKDYVTNPKTKIDGYPSTETGNFTSEMFENEQQSSQCTFQSMFEGCDDLDSSF